MAKQIGYTDADLAALESYETAREFAPSVRAALRFAEKMTRNAHSVTDEDFAELRRHYTEAQVVELASVIGLSNYFNRFTSALRVDLSGTNRPYDDAV